MSGLFEGASAFTSNELVLALDAYYKYRTETDSMYARAVEKAKGIILPAKKFLFFTIEKEQSLYDHIYSESGILGDYWDVADGLAHHELITNAQCSQYRQWSTNGVVTSTAYQIRDLIGCNKDKDAYLNPKQARFVALCFKHGVD